MLILGRATESDKKSTKIVIGKTLKFENFQTKVRGLLQNVKI